MTSRNAKRGDIYYIRGTYGTGSEQKGERPAIIVSNDTGNVHAPIVEVVYLTTKRKTIIPTHVYINSAQRPSIALCEQVVTVCKSRLERYIGSVTVAEMRRIDRALSVSLGIRGGKTMQITMKTPFGDMNFDMPTGKVQQLIQVAVQYAAGDDIEAGKKEYKKPEIEIKAEDKTTAPVVPAREKTKPHRRVDSLFGNMQATQEEEEQAELEEYKGFLMIKCEKCGEIKGFCAKTPIREYKCGCGGRTKLHDLKMVHLHCKCGSHFKYKTNITDERFEHNCLTCGSPVDLELNGRRNTYVTIGD